MLKIYKVSSASAVDFAAEELKRYLRMMMPEAGSISVQYAPCACDGFRVGLLSDFCLPDTDVEDPYMDEILYADCKENGGIIAGNNPRAALLSVYEYLRAEGCRWLFPGVDGEYIPDRTALAPVSFRKKPSCRYRGFANATAASQQTNMELIDFLPKIGMNTFMFEFRIPTYYTDRYYNHVFNEKNRPAEPVTPRQILSWKRSCESEIARRGLLFHDVGHGFCIDAFGIDSSLAWYKSDESHIPEGMRQYLAEVKGKRGFFEGVPINTNFCMSNPEARALVAKNVADYAESHGNVDLLHVWLADGINNHCECEKCKQKIPSDWYIDMLNAIDREMTARNISTRIVFLAYVDISWAPEKTRLENPDRFVFMLAPFTRKYFDSIPKNGIHAKNPPYERNNIFLAETLEEYLAFYNDWRKDFKGPAFAFEYHFCWGEYYDFSRLGMAKLISDEVRLYKSLGIDGVVEDGDLRAFMPNGLLLYTLARTLFDVDTPHDEIVSDYFSHAYGEGFEKFHAYFERVQSSFDWKYFIGLGSENERVGKYYSPMAAKKLSEVAPLIEEGRALAAQYVNSDVRVRTVAVRLFLHYLDILENTARIMAKKAVGEDGAAARLLEDFEADFGKRECEIERYFNHCFYFSVLRYIVISNASKIDFVLG